MIRKTLDPNLASILESIRATVGGEPQSGLGRLPGTPVGLAPHPDREEATDMDQPEDTAPEAASREAGAPAPRKPRNAADVPPAQRTVEEFLAELIRPQVDAWLRANLPELVQKMAADEIARLTGRK